MSEVVSLKGNYTLKVAAELALQAQLFDVDTNSLAEFFGTQAHQMCECPPNLNYFGQKAQVWVMRGFFPGTPLFFKMVVLEQCPNPRSYYVKVTPLRVNHVNKYRGKDDDFLHIEGEQVEELIVKRMENSLLDAKHDIPLIVNTIKMPRCMSPKGMKIFKYEKK